MSSTLNNLNDCRVPVVDPALEAISRFQAARARFEAVLDQKDAAESSLRSVNVEPGTAAHDRARAALGLPNFDAKEELLGKAYESCLSVALSTVPQTPEGLRALGALIQHQARQGAPEVMLGRGADSILAALACANGRNGALTGHTYSR